MIKKVEMPKSGGGLQKVLSVGSAIMTGNPLLAAGALPDNSPAKKAIGLYNQGKGAASMFGSSEQAPDMANGSDSLRMPQLGESAGFAGSPMERKMNELGQDPLALTNQALTLLKDPSIPQEYRDQYAEPLLRAKYYKFGGQA